MKTQALILGLIWSVCSAPVAMVASAVEVEILMTRPVPTMANQQGQMLTVAYAPGESSMPHRHNANVFVYVLEGSIVMQVEGGEEVVLEAGETFHESPADVHMVSRNASDTEPAKFLVFFVNQEGAPISVPHDTNQG